MADTDTKITIARKKAELAEISNGGAWVFIIVGILTSFFLFGIPLILIGLYVMHKNHYKTAELTKDISILEAGLS